MQPWQQWSHLLLPDRVSYYPHILCIHTFPPTAPKKTLTCVRAGNKGKLAVVFVRLHALQGADRLAPLCCVHAAYLEAGQVVAHVPAARDKSSNSRERFEFLAGGINKSYTHVDMGPPVQWFEAASI